MSDTTKKYLDLPGLQEYDAGVKDALSKKENKFHVGDTEPTDTTVDTWLDTTEEDTEPVSLMSLSSEEELTFNEDETTEALTFNEEEDTSVVSSTSDEELTFNETDSDEELTFNEE